MHSNDLTNKRNLLGLADLLISHLERPVNLPAPGDDIDDL